MNCIGIFLKFTPEAPPEGYSPSSTSPNFEYGLPRSSAYEWNPKGNKIIFQGLEIPIVSLNQEGIFL